MCISESTGQASLRLGSIRLPAREDDNLLDRLKHWPSTLDLSRNSDPWSVVRLSATTNLRELVEDSP